MTTYNSSTKRNNSGKLFIIITYFILFISLACLIINFSINHSIKWSLYPIGALIVVWSTISPVVLMKKYRFPLLFAGLTISSILYLLLIQNLVAEKGWFLPLALPIAILSFAAFASSLFFFTRFKLNKLYAAAVTVFLFGVVVNLGVGLIVSGYIKEGNVEDPSKILTAIGSAITALVLVIPVM